MSAVQSFVVDHLPDRLWRQGNLRIQGRLHFCYGGGVQHVRTIEWDSKTLARGSRPRTAEPSGH